MKRIFAVLFLVFTGLSSVFAQDVITLKSGDVMKVHIIRLSPKDVIFIPENSFDTAFLLKKDITQLHYQNGITIFLSEKEIPLPNTTLQSDSLFALGQLDASKYYKGYKPAVAGTIIASIFFPWGLVPAIACSATPPAMRNLGYKDQERMDNLSYFKGYTQKAHDIKKKKVWGGFAIGSGFILGLVIIMSVAVATY